MSEATCACGIVHRQKPDNFDCSCGRPMFADMFKGKNWEENLIDWYNDRDLRTTAEVMEYVRSLLLSERKLVIKGVKAAALKEHEALVNDCPDEGGKWKLAMAQKLILKAIDLFAEESLTNK